MRTLASIMFAALRRPGFAGGPGGPGFAFGRLEREIVVALIGSSIAQAAGLAGLAQSRRRRAPSADRHTDDEP